jgi:hypothetical protein
MQHGRDRNASSEAIELSYHEGPLASLGMGNGLAKLWAVLKTVLSAGLDLSIGRQ